MRKLGKLEMEYRIKMREKFEKERAAEKKLFNERIRLLENDTSFAEKIKCTLENMTFYVRMLMFCGAGGGPYWLTPSIVSVNLQSYHNICVRKENITIDFEKKICFIRLNGEITAKIPIVDEIGHERLTKKQ